MTGPPKNVIAICTDMDLTLTPRYVPEYLIEHFEHDTQEFWKENRDIYQEILAGLKDEDKFPEELRVRRAQQRAGPCYELTYAQTILDHVKYGCPNGGKRWEGLSRGLLRELGQQTEFFPGMPQAIKEDKEWVESNPEWRKHDITLEWYIISTGIYDMIAGSKLASDVDGIFACEFYPRPGEDPATGEIDRVVFPVTYTEKTRFLYVVNKGPDFHVNAKVPHEHRRVPGRNMMYIGDGDSDVPPFAATDNMGGKNVAVYSKEPREDDKYFRQAHSLREQDRVFAIAPADYSDGALIRKLIRRNVEQVADDIIRRKTDAVTRAIGSVPVPDFGPKDI